MNRTRVDPVSRNHTVPCRNENGYTRFSVFKKLCPGNCVVFRNVQQTRHIFILNTYRGVGANRKSIRVKRQLLSVLTVHFRRAKYRTNLSPLVSINPFNQFDWQLRLRIVTNVNRTITRDNIIIGDRDYQQNR